MVYLGHILPFLTFSSFLQYPDHIFLPASCLPCLFVCLVKLFSPFSSAHMKTGPWLHIKRKMTGTIHHGGSTHCPPLEKDLLNLATHFLRCSFFFFHCLVVRSLYIFYIYLYIVDIKLPYIQFSSIFSILGIYFKFLNDVFDF